jgi:predicted AlkP superfamily phosphohydrolase/phosphomutase
MGPWLVKRVQAKFGALHAPLTNSDVRAAAVPNNRCGAIRLNIKGREPRGEVAPGNEAVALMEDIRAVLLELRDPASGDAIVEEVITAREAFGADHHPDVPDLMVVFRNDLGVIEACSSPRFGRVEVPLYHRVLPRTGDHTVRSCLWIAGQGITPGSAGTGNVLDLAPTVLARLGLSAVDGMDGRPLV